MTLVQSAKLNGHDPYAYLKDVLTDTPVAAIISIDGSGGLGIRENVELGVGRHVARQSQRAAHGDHTAHARKRRGVGSRRAGHVHERSKRNNCHGSRRLFL